MMIIDYDGLSCILNLCLWNLKVATYALPICPLQCSLAPAANKVEVTVAQKLLASNHIKSTIDHMHDIMLGCAYVYNAD